MTRNEVLSNLKNLADALVFFLGRNCEIAIHDLSCLDHSLVHIAGNVTGRSVGAPATDFLVRSLEAHGNEVRDVLSYTTTTKSGSPIKASLVFIREKNGRPCFAMCINYNILGHMNAIELLAEQIRVNTVNGWESTKAETFSHTIAETGDVVVENVLKEFGKHPVELNREERIDLVCRFQRAGAFRMKGMVERVASLMGISKYTVYSYRQHCTGN